MLTTHQLLVLLADTLWHSTHSLQKRNHPVRLARGKRTRVNLCLPMSTGKCDVFYELSKNKVGCVVPDPQICKSG